MGKVKSKMKILTNISTNYQETIPTGSPGRVGVSPAKSGIRGEKLWETPRNLSAAAGKLFGWYNDKPGVQFKPARNQDFGLIAEDLATVNPDLVARDEQSKIVTVRLSSGQRDVAERIPQGASQSAGARETG